MTCFVVVRIVGAAPGGVGISVEGAFLYEEAANELAKKGLAEASGKMFEEWKVFRTDLDHSDPEDNVEPKGGTENQDDGPG